MLRSHPVWPMPLLSSGCDCAHCVRSTVAPLFPASSRTTRSDVNKSRMRFSSNKTINEKLEFTIDSIDIGTSAKFFKINVWFENVGINTPSGQMPPCKPWLWPFADWALPGNRKIRKKNLRKLPSNLRITRNESVNLQEMVRFGLPCF